MNLLLGVSVPEMKINESLREAKIFLSVRVRPLLTLGFCSVSLRDLSLKTLSYGITVQK
jgi:hypothetical protein